MQHKNKQQHHKQHDSSKQQHKQHSSGSSNWLAMEAMSASIAASVSTAIASAVTASEQSAKTKFSSLEGRLVDTQMAMSDAAAKAAAAEREAIIRTVAETFKNT